MNKTLGIACALAAAVSVRAIESPRFHNDLTSIDGLVPHLVSLQATSYRGRRAVRMVNAPGEGHAFAIVPGVEMRDGVIDVDVAGQPEKGAHESSRGFIGVAFRVASGEPRFECFYIRPTNGRADDQLRRNHSTQYISVPGFEFDRLRAEKPGVYESYVDLIAGEWTHLRIEVKDQRARFFVGGASQPTLIVNDLIRPAASGGIALWEGDETEGYFSSLEVVSE